MPANLISRATTNRPLRAPSRLAALGGILLILASAGHTPAAPLQINDQQSIVFLGNTFAERMQLFGYFECFLHSRFPGYHLRIRNMGWSADEVDRMIRPRGFPPLTDQLREHEADLIFLCFGMNESFSGGTQVRAFQQALHKFTKDLQAEKFHGDAAPRIVLVSPIAYERVGDELPEGRDRNRMLKKIAEAMADTARQARVRYVDLFNPTAEWIGQTGRRLTFNGIHLTEYGDWVVSQMMAKSLGLVDTIAAPSPHGHAVAERLRRCVFEKNYHYFNWWHPPNASYIYGRRNTTPGSKHLARERTQQEKLVEALDERIWTMPKPHPSEVWKQVPTDGRPIWFPLPEDQLIRGAGEEARWSIASDGADDPQIRTPQEELKRFRLPDGYQINLFASEQRFPIANPMAIQFDAQGRLWVANTPTWPHPLPGKRPKDSIVILTDSDRDGRADRHTVFLDNMNLIHGFGLADEGAYVAQTPNLILARDSDGDGVADWLRNVLHGFGAEDAEHAMNNFRWSPGGSLLFTQGVFYNTQVETPYGPVRVKDAAVFRYRPEEHRLGVYVSHQWSNPYGHLFGRWGRGIVLDASAGQYYAMDMLSANFHFPKQKERTEHLAFGPGGSIAAGCEMLVSRHFPPEVQGRFLVNHCEGDVGTHWYTLRPKGTNYEIERHDPPLVVSGDRTFRPVAMTIGPDGALYLADFYSHIFENVNFSKRHPGRDHSHGRIWRITHVSRPLVERPKTRGSPVEALLDLLTCYENGTRQAARRELQRRGRAAVAPHLRRWIATHRPSDDDYEHHLVEALWVHQSLNDINTDLLRQLLTATRPEARVAATQVLRYWQDHIDDSLELIRQRIHDPDARVRLHAVLACGFNESAEAMETALEAAEHEMDPGLEHALNQTLDFLEKRALKVDAR